MKYVVKDSAIRLTHAADSCTLTNIKKKKDVLATLLEPLGNFWSLSLSPAHLPDVTDVQSLPSFIPLRETCYTETSFTINQWFHFSFWLLSVCLYWFLMELPRHESHDCFCYRTLEITHQFQVPGGGACLDLLRIYSPCIPTRWKFAQC